MGHSTGISDSYYRPKEIEVLNDYLKVIDLLTINSNNIALKKQVQKLEEENKNSDYIIKGRLQEKDIEVQELRLKDKLEDDVISNISDQLITITKKLEKLEKR